MERHFQSRLGKFHDKIRRKLIANKVSLTGQITDTIRVRLKKSKQGDIVSRVVDSVDVVPVVFPILKDVPYRRLPAEGEKDPTKIQLESLWQVNDLFPIEIYTPDYDKIYIGDLIFRVIMEPDIEYPLVMVLEVQEALGTFGVRSMIYSKFQATYYNETLPDEILDYVSAAAKRRLHLQW
jgi:hypothetical protein